ncbi:MAG: hypothetical protein ACPG8W_23465, partial [Candidatus Promineifilaceae bacterium]
MICYFNSAENLTVNTFEQGSIDALLSKVYNFVKNSLLSFMMTINNLIEATLHKHVAAPVQPIQITQRDG